ncbi:MAG: hypothetical protein M1142_00995 [Patescibacteria group bacterium]|nr:hypothetical protein [Patescibacteria group bacterium]
MDKINVEKIDMWKKKLQKMEVEYEEIMQKRGEAMAMGDLRENAAFQMLDEDAATWRVKIDEVKKIIEKLESGETH